MTSKEGPTVAARQDAEAPGLDPGNQPWLLGIARKWWVAGVAVIGCALTEMAFSGVLFGTPALVQALGTDVYRYGWALLPYLVLLIVIAIFATRLQMQFGARVLFVLGMLLLGTGALVAAGATSLEQLIVARVIMSGKGLALAVALTQLWLVFPRRKGLALALYGCALYGGMALGVGAGAFVAYNPTWRVAYLVCGGGGLLVAWAAWRAMIPDRPATPPRMGWDVTGLVLLIICLAAGTMLSLWGQYYGWLSSPLMLVAIGVTVVSAALFVWRESVARDPLVSLGFTPFKTLVLTLGVLGLFGAMLVGLLETLPGFFMLRGYQGADVGWILLPCGIVFCLMVILGGSFTTRRWTVQVLRTGLLLSTIALVLLVLHLDLYASRAWFRWVLILWAAGAGLVLPTALVLTFAGQSPEWVQRLASIKVALRFLALIFGSNAVAVIAARGTQANFDLLRQEIDRGRPVVWQVERRLQVHATGLGAHPAEAAAQSKMIVARWVRANADWLGYRDGLIYLVLLNGGALAFALCLSSKPEATILDSDEAMPSPTALLRQRLFVPGVRVLAVGAAPLALLCGAPGCSMTPPYEIPEIPMTETWRTPAPITPSGATIADLAWWQLFEDPALRALVATALERNRDIAIAAARIAESRASLRSSASRQAPTVNAFGSVVPRRFSENSPLTPDGGPGWTFYGMGLDLSYEVDLWGRIEASTGAARAELLASEEAYRFVTIALVADVGQEYFRLRQLDAALAIVIAATEDRGEALRIVRERERHGVASELDVAQAEAEYEGTAADVPQYQRLVAESEERMGVLLGGAAGPLARGLDLAAQPVPPALPAGVPADVLLRRPDVRAAEQSLRASNFRIGEARADFYPRLVIFGAGGLESVEASDILDSSSLFGLIGPAVSVPLFTGGRLEGALDAATARQQQAVALYQRTVLESLREVNDALVAFAKSGERLTRQGREVDAARRALEAAKRRYLHGLSSYLEVLDAQRVLLAAELERNGTTLERLNAVVRLYRALGGGWGSEGLPEAGELLGEGRDSSRTASTMRP